MTSKTIEFAPISVHPGFVNITHRRFTRLRVLGYAGCVNGSYKWWCECDCGTIKTYHSSALKSEKTKSCGCIIREFNTSTKTKHGHNADGFITPEYNAFKSAKKRCTNCKHKSWKDYGGRGIEFRFETFEAFFRELGSRPSDRHSLDRFPNNNGHYEPGNVRWAAIEDQQRNRRSNRLINVNGATVTVAQAAEIVGIPYARLSKRLSAGWPLERALHPGNLRRKLKEQLSS